VFHADEYQGYVGTRHHAVSALAREDDGRRTDTDPLLSVFYINVLAPLDANRMVEHILEQTEREKRCPFRCVPSSP
jgi:hypothetical protein